MAKAKKPSTTPVQAVTHKTRSKTSVHQTTHKATKQNNRLTQNKPTKKPARTAKRTAVNRRRATRRGSVILLVASLIILCAVAIIPTNHQTPPHASKTVQTSQSHKKPTVRAAQKPVQAPAQVKPLTSDLPSITTPSGDCTHGTTMNIVAHEDDDILFMNPDLQHDIQAGMCVTTVYLTAGDGGRGPGYWERRERAIEAVYSQMYQQTNDWQLHSVLLNQHNITLARLPQTPSLTLVFLRLPDGNLRGTGFPETGYQSLVALESGQISSIHSVDGASTYTSDQLVYGLTTLMNIYNPSKINTQNYTGRLDDGDHSDHHAAGAFAALAYSAYHKDSILRAYAGYTIRNMDQNVTGSDLEAKQATFLTYATNDPIACISIQICERESSYGAYLERQYSRIVATH
jgi:LmbE family N-acetylglucosaminyl deacetylase